MERAFVLASSLVAIAAIVACSSTSSSTNKPGGAACTSSSECNSEACLDLPVVSSDGGCTSVGKACSLKCAFDSDCVALGAGFKCFGGCGATMVCGATQ